MEDTRKSINLFKIFRECLLLLYKYQKSYIFLTLFFTTILGVSPALSLIVMQSIINSLQVGNVQLNGIFLLIGVYIVIDLVSSLVNVLSTLVSNKVMLTFSKKIEMDLLEKATSLKLDELEDSNIHNMINRARSQGQSKIMTFFASSLLIIKQIVTIFSSVAIVIGYQPWMLLVVLIIPIIKYIFTFRQNRIRFEIRRKRTTRDRKIYYIAYLIFTGAAFKEIRLFGLKDYLLSKYAEYTDQNIEEDVTIFKRLSKGYSILNTIDNIMGGAIFASIVYSGFVGTILIGDVVTFTRCIFNVKSNIESIFNVVDILQRDALDVSQYFEFMNYKNPSPHNGTHLIDCIKSISIRDVSFKYKGTNKYVLKNVSFDINAMQTMVFIGKNGSGKTTMMKLLMGFYDDYEGTILVNGINLKDINKSHYQTLIGCIFQDYMKYEATVRENVAFGNLRQLHNDSKILHMLHYSGFNREGQKNLELESYLGTWFNNAKPISGGEWQRIALARAFIKEADLYILDEPDASLDTETEFETLSKYKELMKRGIGIYSSHKFNRINYLADSILVFQDGRIVERGTHESLLNSQGLYYNFYMLSQEKL